MISRAINKLNRLWTDISFAFGILRPEGQGKRIIMYHGIDKKGCKAFNLRYVSIADFERQIAFYKKNFNILTIHDYFQKKIIKNKINIAITFDDGMYNNFKYALPILEKYKVPATFLVTGLNEVGYRFIWSDFIDIAEKLVTKDIIIDNINYVKKGKNWYDLYSNKSLKDIIKDKGTFEFKQKVIREIEKIIPKFWEDEKYFDYWKLMSDENIYIASKSKYITIGSHGYYHNNLGNIVLEDVKDELEKSKRYIENITQKTCDVLGYPDGSYTREVIDVAESLGF
ncbi:MAG TPA: polysaccharide deacetylase family protein, partial [Bacteroidales bacterium]|nr:polysaccharide deacetylase family protein [Bacteroidales bacterium]